MSEQSVFVSTGALRGVATDIAEELLAAGVSSLELSGGRPHLDLVDRVVALSEKACVQLHNYFPPADPPFVFNLASADAEIRERTIECMLASIELSAKVGARRYSVHAGFLCDPPVAYLGQSWRELQCQSPEQGMDIFVSSVGVLKDAADRQGIELLVENNVLTAGTRDECGPDVLLMASEAQITDAMERLPEGVGLLLDVAHLKVSATTLGFDPFDALVSLRSHTRGYHLSDNDGLSDSGDQVSSDAWFWSGLGSDIPFATLEVHGDPQTLREQVALTRDLWREGATNGAH